MSSILSNEGELYLAPSGTLLRLMQRIGIVRKGNWPIARRITALLLITWVPMALFAFLQGCALGTTPRGSFLLDFATHARFFLGIPILVMADTIIGPRLTLAGLQFVRDGLVPQEDFPSFERAISRLARRRESAWATLVLFALATFGAWNFTLETLGGGVTVGWHSVILPEGHALRYSLAALWNYIVAVPVFLFLGYRWLWRILIWTLFLSDVSRMHLQLVPTHADRAGGLGFLEFTHAAFGNFAFLLGSVLSAEAAFRIVFEGGGIETIEIPLAVLIVVTEILCLGPLLVFAPALTRARRAGLFAYGSLVDQYNRDFHSKWSGTRGAGSEKFVGSPDIQSLADMGNSFRFVDQMLPVPFSRRLVILVAAATALPALPLLLLVMPLGELVSTIAKIAI